MKGLVDSEKTLTHAELVLGAERDGPGVFEHPPPNSALGPVATRGKRYSKERQKSLRSCFSNFLGQVKGQGALGHQRSNYAFFTIFARFDLKSVV